LGKALADQLGGDQPVDLWPFFKALGDVPLLAIRGALSDVLSAEIFARMQVENPQMQAIVIENRGHIPLLDEPPLLAKMDDFIAGIRWTAVRSIRARRKRCAASRRCGTPASGIARAQ